MLVVVVIIIGTVLTAARDEVCTNCCYRRRHNITRSGSSLFTRLVDRLTSARSSAIASQCAIDGECSRLVLFRCGCSHSSGGTTTVLRATVWLPLLPFLLLPMAASAQVMVAYEKDKKKRKRRKARQKGARNSGSSINRYLYLTIFTSDARELPYNASNKNEEKQNHGEWPCVFVWVYLKEGGDHSRASNCLYVDRSVRRSAGLCVERQIGWQDTPSLWTATEPMPQ